MLINIPLSFWNPCSTEICSLSWSYRKLSSNKSTIIVFIRLRTLIPWSIVAKNFLFWKLDQYAKLNSLPLVKAILTFHLCEIDELSLLIDRADPLLENLRHFDSSLNLAIKCLDWNCLALVKLVNRNWNLFSHALHFVAKEEVSINEVRLMILMRLKRFLLAQLFLLQWSTRDQRLGFLLGFGLYRCLLCSLISPLSALIPPSTLSRLSLGNHLRILCNLLRYTHNNFLDRNHILIWSRRRWVCGVILRFDLLIDRWPVDGSHRASFHQDERRVSVQDAMINYSDDLEGRVCLFWWKSAGVWVHLN